MTVYDFIQRHPDNHLRIVRVIPSEYVKGWHDVRFASNGWAGVTVFDSSTGDGDLSPDLLLEELANDPEDEVDDEDRFDPDYVWQLEYIPDQYRRCR